MMKEKEDTMMHDLSNLSQPARFFDRPLTGGIFLPNQNFVQEKVHVTIMAKERKRSLLYLSSSLAE